jgi:ABC-type uncharacterized transport system auxiliary subunit
MAGALAALLAGCAGLHSAERADQVYTLEAAAPAEPLAAADAPVATGTNEVRPTLQLLRPLAAPGLDTDRSLVASAEAESVTPVAENRLQAVIAAYRKAVGEALGQLVARLP